MGKEVNKLNLDRQRQRYDKAFKLNAVALLKAGNKPATQLALELGIRRNLLYKWAEVLERSGGDVNQWGHVNQWGQTPLILTFHLSINKLIQQ